MRVSVFFKQIYMRVLCMYASGNNEICRENIIVLHPPTGAEVFCINGMEIDLTELNEFEAKLKAKRKLATENEKSNEANNIATSSSTADLGGKQNDDAIDELDEYLNQLAIDIQLRDNSQTKVAAATASIDTKPLLTVDAAVDEPTAAVQAVDQGVVAIPAAAAGQPKSTVPFGVLLYWFMGIVFFVNTVKRTSCKRRSNCMGN